MKSLDVSQIALLTLDMLNRLSFRDDVSFWSFFGQQLEGMMGHFSLQPGEDGDKSPLRNCWLKLEQKQLSTSPKLLPHICSSGRKDIKIIKHNPNRFPKMAKQPMRKSRNHRDSAKSGKIFHRWFQHLIKNLPEIGVIPNFGLVKWWNMVKPRHGTTQFLGWSGSQKDHPT